MKSEPKYKADLRYLEESTFMVMVEMLERLPSLKPRIKRYLETFPSISERATTSLVERHGREK